MLHPADNYFSNLGEPMKGCMLFLRAYILKQDDLISEKWKYGMPFYEYRGRMLCYLWTHKKYRRPYIGIVEGKRINHPDLLIEKRSRMAILLVNPAEDIPIEKIDEILNEAIKLYK